MVGFKNSLLLRKSGSFGKRIQGVQDGRIPFGTLRAAFDHLQDDR
jgi:hypothetical protein